MKRSEARTIISACLISTSGAIVYLISPVLVGSAMDSMGLGSDEAGLLIASYFAGYTAITVSAVFWLHLADMRAVASLSSLALIAGLLLATVQSSMAGSVVAMLVAGAGAGMLYGISIAIISQSNDPDRFFGFALASQLLFGSALLFAGPAWIGPNFGYNGIMIATAIFVVILSPVIVWVPRSCIDDLVTDASAGGGTNVPLVMAGVFAVLIWFSGLSGVYAFVERIGVAGGISGQEIGLVLSLTIVTGMAGAFGAAWLGDRFGKIVPHIAGAAGISIALLLLLRQPGLARYSLAIVFLTLSWNFWLAYMLGAVAAIDVSGRFAVLTTAALGIGATLGPAIAGGLIDGSDFQPMFATAGIALGLGLVTIVYILRRIPGASDMRETK